MGGGREAGMRTHGVGRTEAGPGEGPVGQQERSPEVSSRGGARGRLRPGTPKRLLPRARASVKQAPPGGRKQHGSIAALAGAPP